MASGHFRSQQSGQRGIAAGRIDKKIEEGQFEAVTDVEADEPAAKKDGKVVDLMDYLKKSVEEAKGDRKSGTRKSSKKKQTKGKAKAKKKRTSKKKAAKESTGKKSAKKQSRKRKAS